MKRATQCLVVLLLVSFAYAVNLSQVADSFGKKHTSYSSSSVDNFSFYGDFFPNFTKLLQGLINDLILELFRQLRLQSHVLANSINSASEELQYAIQDPNRNQSDTYVQSILNKMNFRLKKYLDLGPGELNQTTVALRDIDENESIEKVATYHSLKRLFTNLGDVMDTHLSNIQILVDNFYKNGWRLARRTYLLVQDDFRKEYLNGYLLDAYGKAVVNTLGKKDIIQKFVKPATWEIFVERATPIKALYEKIHPIVNPEA